MKNRINRYRLSFIAGVLIMVMTTLYPAKDYLDKAPEVSSITEEGCIQVTLKVSRDLLKRCIIVLKIIAKLLERNF